MTSSAVCSCLAVSLTPLPFIRRPHSPYARVVPLIEPPIGIGMTPLCLLMYLTFLGASWCRNLAPRTESDWPEDDQGQREYWERQEAYAALTLVRVLERKENIGVGMRHASRISKAHPVPPLTTTLQVSVATMGDRKRAFEGSGDSNTLKRFKRFVFPR